MPRNVDLTFRQRKQTALPLPRTRPAFSGPPPPRDRAGPDNQQAQRSSPMHMSPRPGTVVLAATGKRCDRLRVGGVLLRSPGAPSESGMQRVPFCHRSSILPERLLALVDSKSKTLCAGVWLQNNDP